MLRASFQHFDRISARREREFWNQGVTSWEELAATDPQLRFFSDIDRYAQSIADAQKALRTGNTRFFAHRLPKREHYRIPLTFPNNTLFLDIETTGLSQYYDHITLIGWSIGTEYGAYIRGTDETAFRKAVEDANAIVTFNGSIFDLPFIRQEFPDLSLDLPHVDLRFFGRRAGLAGSQKEIERFLGFNRSNDLASLDGRAAVILWHRYRRGDLEALKQLIRYNHADIEGMKAILDAAADRVLRQEGVPDGVRPEVRFSELSASLKWSENGKLSQEKRCLVPIVEYPGNVKPDITFDDLCRGAPLKGFRSVGIDLSGSEARRTGWSLLHDGVAETRLLYSDEEILEATCACKPDVVSIDSPLSMPYGRTRVTDDDPGRNEHGIMRVCERQLKKRGINVYPCLIKSMQRLTERGMRLADKLRKRGVPVIESYPGAAQDIMKIPRKGTSLEYLTEGLRDFGLHGDWESGAASHDELDAITSAVVGVFWWAGRFEALGDEEEGQIVVPALEVEPRTWLSRSVIGFSGQIGSGKSTAAHIADERGYQYGRFSQVLADLLEQRGIEPTRAALQEIGQEVHEAPGQRWLCRRLAQRLPEEGDIVIDGLRHPEDHSFLTERYGPAFRHIFIETPADARREHYAEKHGGDTDFDGAEQHAVESNVERLRKLAHRRIKNDATIDAFRRRVQRALRESRMKG